MQVRCYNCDAWATGWRSYRPDTGRSYDLPMCNRHLDELVRAQAAQEAPLVDDEPELVEETLELDLDYNRSGREL